MSYLIKKDVDTKEIVYMQYQLRGYKYKPKKQSESYISIDEVMFIKPSLNDKMLSIWFKKYYEKLVRYIFYILNSDDAGNAETNIALSEIARLRNIILNEYQDFLSDQVEAAFLAQLRDLENKLRYKTRIISDDMNINLEEEPLEKGKSM